MSKTSRRALIKKGIAGAMVAAGFRNGNSLLFASTRKSSDVRIVGITFDFEEFVFRTPLKFAGVVVDRQTMLTVHCTVRTVSGREAKGFGTLPLNYTFTFPSKVLSPMARQDAMKALAAEIATVTSEYPEFGHPMDIHQDLSPAYLRAATAVSERLQLADPIPKLCTLVTAGAFDAAIHDAFGKVHGVSCFHTYGPEFMNHDLSHYLGADYRDEYPDFNEKCPNVDYFLAFLRQVKEQMPRGFQRIEYVEQPTHRDLKAHPENDMHQAAKLCPVVIDESVIDVDSVHLARELGWTGVVVKSPKGLTHMLLIAALLESTDCA